MAEKHLHLVKEAVRGYPHSFVGVIPFGDEITANHDITGTGFIPYGSTRMTTIALEQYNWKGLYFDLDKFNYRTFDENCVDMLNGGQCITNVKDAITNLREDNRELVFVRPSKDLKQFSGMVIEPKECADWLEDAVECDSSGSYAMEMDTEIVIAEPCNIWEEHRWFIVGGKIVSGCRYKKNNRLVGERITDEGYISWIQKQFVDKWLPSPCCVMDTALCDDNAHYIIEFNCINSSGFYDHDVSATFKALWEYTYENP